MFVFSVAAGRAANLFFHTHICLSVKNKILYRRENLVTIQKNIKMFLCKRKHQPRYKTMLKIRELESMAGRMESTMQQLKKDRAVIETELKEFVRDLVSSRQKIKVPTPAYHELLISLYNYLLIKYYYCIIYYNTTFRISLNGITN